MNIHRLIMITVTVVTLAMVAVANMGSEINCDRNETWSTAEGVRHCAINGGK